MSDNDQGVPDELVAQNTGTSKWSNLAGAASLGIFFAIGLIAALILPLGALSKPGPGWWPASIAALGLLLVIVRLVALVSGRSAESGFPAPQIMWWRATFFIAPLVVFMLLYPYLGFLPVAIPLCFILLRFASGASWRASAIVGAVAPVTLYVIFSNFLMVPL